MYGAEPVYNGNTSLPRLSPGLLNHPEHPHQRAERPAPQGLSLRVLGGGLNNQSQRVGSARDAGAELRRRGSRQRTSFALQYSTDAKVWKTLKTVSTDASGKYTVTAKPSAAVTYYRLWNSRTYYTVRKAIKVTRQALLSVPSVALTARANVAFKVTGYVGPRHAVGSKVVRLDCYRLESGTYRLRTSVYATCSARDSATSRYAASVTLPRGTWRMSAYHTGDSSHISTRSAVRAFTL